MGPATSAPVVSDSLYHHPERAVMNLDDNCPASPLSAMSTCRSSPTPEPIFPNSNATFASAAPDNHAVLEAFDDLCPPSPLSLISSCPSSPPPSPVVLLAHSPPPISSCTTKLLKAPTSLNPAVDDPVNIISPPSSPFSPIGSPGNLLTTSSFASAVTSSNPKTWRRPHSLFITEPEPEAQCDCCTSHPNVPTAILRGHLSTAFRAYDHVPYLGVVEWREGEGVTRFSTLPNLYPSTYLLQLQRSPPRVPQELLPTTYASLQLAGAVSLNHNLSMCEGEGTDALFRVYPAALAENAKREVSACAEARRRKVDDLLPVILFAGVTLLDIKCRRGLVEDLSPMVVTEMPGSPQYGWSQEDVDAVDDAYGRLHRAGLIHGSVSWRNVWFGTFANGAVRLWIVNWEEGRVACGQDVDAESVNVEDMCQDMVQVF
ncbi:hypothetical protein HK101_007940 [Irineochytrium annulatum]|nr:hypothetical protein HK101_007940 [Irineochytrium annulatum]